MGLTDFQILSKLGEGSYSSVWKVKRISDGQEYALKKVKLTSLTEKEKQNSVNEVRILASIQNPAIIGYKEAFLEENNTVLCIVMEYAAGGDLYNKILEHQKAKTFFKEEDIWRYAIQMIMGLKTLHGMKILHRDLKCANVFLSKDGKDAKLGDLNVSKVLKTNLVYTQTGTPYYASPEIWRDQPYDMKSDIWSLGCVIYEAAALKPPFRAKNMDGLYKKVQKGVFDRIPALYSNDLFHLISLCLKVSSVMRPTCEQLFKHPVIQRNCKEYLTSIGELSETNALLSTIRMPKNLRALGPILPKPNYHREKLYTESDAKKLPQIGGGDLSMYMSRGYGGVYKTISTAEDERISLRHDSSVESRLSSISRLDPNLARMLERESVMKPGNELYDRVRKLKAEEYHTPKELSVLSENVKHLKPSGYKHIAGRRPGKESQIPEIRKMDSLDEYDAHLRRYSNNPSDVRSKSTIPRREPQKSRENLLPHDLVSLTMLENGKLVATRDVTPHKILLKQNDVVNSYRNRSHGLENKYNSKPMIDKVLDDDLILSSKARAIIGKHVVPNRAYNNKSSLDGHAQRSGDGSYYEYAKDGLDGLSHQSYVSEMRNAYGQPSIDDKERPRLQRKIEHGYPHSHSHKYMQEHLIQKESTEAYLKKRRFQKHENL